MGWFNLKRNWLKGERIVVFGFRLPRVFNPDEDGNVQRVPEHYFEVVEDELTGIFGEEGHTRTEGEGVYKDDDPEPIYEFILELPKRPKRNMKTYVHFFRVYQRILRARFDQIEISMWVDHLRVGRVRMLEYQMPQWPER